MHHLFAALLIIGATSLESAPPPVEHLEFVPKEGKDPLPPWRYADMTKVIVHESRAWKPREVDGVELLAWRATVDERPLYLNVAVFVVRLEGGRWALVQLGQTPIPTSRQTKNERDQETRWHIYSRISDSDWQPVTVFRQRPTSRQVEQFFESWQLVGERPPSVITEGVRSETWKSVLGMSPLATLKRT
jgi:hypothetical protein